VSSTMWHFATVDKAGVPRLGYGDGREVRVGETLTVDCEPVVCQAGLHACPRALDALQYVTGSVVACAVTLGGTIVQGTNAHADKYAATERTVVGMLTAAQTDAVLGAFARWCALQVAYLWEMPDIVREYLTTGNESDRDAAMDAAMDAASAAARAADADAAAAWAATRAAAWAAAWAATRAAAWDAAWVAAGAAARAAAWGAAGAAQNEQLERMALEAMQVQENSNE